MSEFWVANISGLWDMRSALGPFQDIDHANAAIGLLPTFERNGFKPDRPVREGDWFAIHRDSECRTVEDFVMVQGPYPDRDTAEAERVQSVEEWFEVDCNGHHGFVAQVVKVFPEWRAVFVR